MPMWMIYALFIVIAVAVLVISSKGKGSSNKELARLKSLMPRKKERKPVLGAKLYDLLRNVPVVKRILEDSRLRYEILNVWDESTVKSKSATETFKLISGAVIYLLLVFGMEVSIYTRMAFIGLGFFLWVLFTQSPVERLKEKLLRDLDTLISSLKFSYHQTKMVSVSLMRVADANPRNIASKHFKQIAKVLNSLNPEAEILSYYDVAPNSHFKKLADMSLTVQMYGEDEATGSVYIESLQSIVEEVRLDILKKKKLKENTKGSLFMATVPILVVEPAKNWVESSFPDAAGYYYSAVGFYATIVLYTITFLIMYVNRLISKFSEADPAQSALEGRTLRKIAKMRAVDKFLSMLAPDDEKTVKSVKIVRKTVPLLRSASSRLSVKEFYLQKVIMAVVFFAVTLFAQNNFIYISKNYLVDPKVYDLPSTSTKEYTEKNRKIFEREAIIEFANKGLTADELYSSIMTSLDGQSFIKGFSNVDEFIFPLISKIRNYENSHYKWTDLLLALLISMVGYNLPRVLLKVKSSLRSSDRQEEVDGFISLLTILSKFENVMVKDMLVKMHRYSIVFRSHLEKCILNYTSGPKEALQELKLEARFVPLERLVERLESTDRISVKDAFADLDQDRAFMLEERKLLTEKSITDRAAITNLLSWIPIGAVMIIYISAPIFMYLVQSLSGVSEYM
jgi:hypothetical protein